MAESTPYIDPLLMAPQPVAGEQEKLIERDPPDVPPERAALVKEWQGKIEKAKAHWRPKFEKMRKDMAFVRGKQWDGSEDDRYVCNITLRHMQQRTAAIYAKNPTFTAKRKPRLDFAIWNGDPQELQMAQVSAQAGDPTAIELLQDVQRGMQYQQLISRIGKTLEVIHAHQLNEQIPRFKPEMKQLIRRVKTLGVGFVQLGYQRVYDGYTKATQARMSDDSNRIEELERMAADVADGEAFEQEAELEKLRLGLAALQTAPDLVVYEGLVYEFLRVDQLIVDPECTQLKGFRDAKWIAREYNYKPERVRAIWKKDVGTQAVQPGEQRPGVDGDQGTVRVFCIYDLRLKLQYMIAEGYPDFLEEPTEPKIWLEQFHPFYTLSFNDVEDDKDPYPPSDVDLIRHGQREINRSSEAKREHRIASRPAWLTAKGLLTGQDKEKLQSHESNEVIELDALTAADDKRTQDKIQPKPIAPLEPALYETESIYGDVLRATGDQEANLGPTGGDTATEATIAENSRVTSLQSEIDDIDEFLTDLARGASQILLMEMSEETVKRIAGPGAVWPNLDRKQVADELYLEIVAGSSGRPNRSLKIANKERLAPFILQIPGVNPAWWFKSLARELEEEDELEEAYIHGLPSITAMNQMTQPSTGNPATDPNAQGPEGRSNRPAPQETEPGPQPALPGQGPEPIPMPRRAGGSGIV